MTNLKDWVPLAFSFRTIRIIVPNITQAGLTPLALSRKQTQGGKFFTFFFLVLLSLQPSFHSLNFF